MVRLQSKTARELVAGGAAAALTLAIVVGLTSGPAIARALPAALDEQQSAGDDRDYDGIANPADNCPNHANPNQQDGDGNGAGDVCEVNLAAVPWNGSDTSPHVVYSGGSLILQASASLAGDPVPLTAATWDPGDGTGPVPVPFDNSRVIELEHTYTGSAFQSYTATVRVTDATGRVFTDTFKVRIVERTLGAEVNMAIDCGLWYEHRRMIVGQAGLLTVGSWTDDNEVMSTAAAVRAFESNGHLASGNALANPFVDDVGRGLRFLQAHLLRIALDSQGHLGTPDDPSPDTNGNGYGLETDGGDVVFVGGQIVGAFVASGTPSALASVGSEAGRSYSAIAQDLLDTYSWGQNEDGYGGWVVDWNCQCGIDPRMSAWWGIGVTAANPWGLVVPQWVKEQNLTLGVTALQSWGIAGSEPDTGDYGSCSATAAWQETSPSATAACLNLMTADGLSGTDNQYQIAERYLVRNWTSHELHGHIYAMSYLADAMRSAPGGPITLLGGSLDWYNTDPFPNSPADSRNGFARWLVGTQWSDGSWDEGSGVAGTTSTAWAVLILKPVLFEEGPTAFCRVNAAAACPGGACQTAGVDPFTLTNLDGSLSIEGDNPITSFAWDFGDGSTAAGVSASHSWSNQSLFNVQLTVTDAHNYSSTATCTVQVADFTGPTVTQANLSAPATGASGAVMQFTPSVIDAVDPAPTVSCTPQSGTRFAIGTTPVTCTATDASGNSGAATFTVSVLNNLPVLSVPANVSVTTSNPSGAPVSFTATGSDLEDGTPAVSCVPASGSTFPVGTTSVACSALDANGGSASASFTVIVVLNATNRPPSFTPPANITVASTGSSGVKVSFTAVGSDPEDGSVPAVCVAPSGSTFPVGTSTVRCTVTDSGGLSASGSFVVTVTKSNHKNKPPVILGFGFRAFATSPAGAKLHYKTWALDCED